MSPAPKEWDTKNMRSIDDLWFKSEESLACIKADLHLFLNNERLSIVKTPDIVKRLQNVSSWQNVSKIKFIEWLKDLRELNLASQ